jgi:CRP-like cAMP-binding protein
VIFAEKLVIARRLLLAHLAAPESFFSAHLVSLSFAATVLAILRLTSLRAMHVRFVPASLRLTGFLLVRLSVEDDDALLVSRKKFTLYHLAHLFLPWALAGGLMALTESHLLGTGAATLALSFALLGFLSLCPLFRSPLVRLVEGWLAAFQVLDAGHLYLKRGLFRSLKKDRARTVNPDQPYEWAALGFASLAMLWLYVASVLLSGAFLTLVPQLWAQATVSSSLPRALAAGVLVFLLGLGAVLFAARLVLIPLGNFATVAAVPLRRARRKRARRSQRDPGSLPAFLRGLPIFGHFDDTALEELAGRMRQVTYKRGRKIIEQGERGDDLFVLASGEAQVVITSADGRESIVSVLQPGDAFGEIALLERGPRTATVRTTQRSQVYVLGRRDFDRLYPEGSEERALLTGNLRLIKLILEAQALSHLTTRQVRKLLSKAQTVSFSSGQRIVSEGEEGDAVYLICEGKAKVSQGGEELAVLGPGDLVGIISLVKGGIRTADVDAEGPVRCLRLPKPLFLQLCFANPLVALLVADLSDRQSSELKQAAGY